MHKNTIYVDNAATTKISDSCFEAMLPFLKEKYANPSSMYKMANEAKIAIETARKKAALAFCSSPEEIYFTSCATESNNWAIKCAAKKGLEQGKNHVITTNIEHHSVLETFKSLQKYGIKITYLEANNEGLIDPKQVEEAINKETSLVSVMYANNEIGTIQPIDSIADICKQKNVTFHTDAVQAVGHIPIDLSKVNIDMLSMSGHKIHAPKGVGLLYIKNGLKLGSFLHGGAQESGKRAGTENVAYIVALGKALEDITKNIEQKEAKLKVLQKILIDGITKNIEKVRVNGSLQKRLNSNVNFSFEGIEGESILLMLDSYGICASSGSACTSNTLEPSHVLLAIGLAPEIAHGSLRISLSEYNTEEEMKKIVEATIKTVDKLRKMSPIWK